MVEEDPVKSNVMVNGNFPWGKAIKQSSTVCHWVSKNQIKGATHYDNINNTKT